MSPHQMGLKDLLAVSRLRGIEPGEMVLVGVQPENIGMGTELSPAIAAHLDELIDKALRELDRWGIRVERNLPVQRIIHHETLNCSSKGNP
jgi:hydrogenase maturation protease